MERKKAVVIGINEYEDPGFGKLKYAENDARAIYDVLINPDIGDFAKEDVTLLSGKSKSEVEESLETVLSEAKKDDLVFIYFAGHGKLDKSGSLCLAARNTKIDRLLATSVHLEQIRRIIDQSDCRRVVFIIDSCFSGAVGQSFRSGDVPAEALEQISGQGKVIISASQAFERARERDDIGHGIFTHSLVKGLEEGEADRDETGYISIEELYRYTYDKVKAETKGQQVPMKWGMDEKGEIVIAKSIKTLREKREEIERLSRSAREAQNQGRLDEALDVWNQVLKLDPKNLAAPQTIKQIEAEKQKRAELEAKIDRLFHLYDKGEIPGSIYNKAVEIVRKPHSALSDDEKRCARLVEDLVHGHLTVDNFILSWSRIEKLELPLKPPADPELEREKERKAEAEKIAREKERQRLEQLGALYRQAQELDRASQWREALGKMSAIYALDPEFADPERIAARAQEQLRREAERLERQAREHEAREREAREQETRGRDVHELDIIQNTIEKINSTFTVWTTRLGDLLGVLIGGVLGTVLGAIVGISMFGTDSAYEAQLGAITILGGVAGIFVAMHRRRQSRLAHGPLTGGLSKSKWLYGALGVVGLLLLAVMEVQWEKSQLQIPEELVGPATIEKESPVQPPYEANTLTTPKPDIVTRPATSRAPTTRTPVRTPASYGGFDVIGKYPTVVQVYDPG
jgi:uncharacterized caspase-like protein